MVAKNCGWGTALKTIDLSQPQSFLRPACCFLQEESLWADAKFLAGQLKIGTLCLFYCWKIALFLVALLAFNLTCRILPFYSSSINATLSRSTFMLILVSLSFSRNSQRHYPSHERFQTQKRKKMYDHFLFDPNLTHWKRLRAFKPPRFDRTLGQYLYLYWFN